MTITVDNVTDPKLSRGGGIDVMLSTKEQGVIPCTLHPDDTAAYVLGNEPVTNGDLYRKAKNGEFGTVAS